MLMFMLRMVLTILSETESRLLVGSAVALLMANESPSHPRVLSVSSEYLCNRTHAHTRTHAKQKR